MTSLNYDGLLCMTFIVSSHLTDLLYVCVSTSMACKFMAVSQIQLAEMAFLMASFFLQEDCVIHPQN